MISVPIVLVKLVALVFSLGVAYLAFYGYRRNESVPMLSVAAGFVFIGVGAVCESLVYRVLDTSLLSAAVVQTGLVSVGMLLILASLVLGPDSAAVSSDGD
jgi:hypothetical protein